MITDPLENLLRTLSVWFVTLCVLPFIFTYWEYNRYYLLYMDPEEKRKKQERKTLRLAKWGPYYLPLYNALIAPLALIRAKGADFHDAMLDYSWYWKIMKVSFSLQTLFYNFRGEGNPGKLRIFIAHTLYQWPKWVAIVCIIIEPFARGQLSYTRSYLGIIFFFYLLLRVIRFLALEYYRWMGPLLITTSPNEIDFDPTTEENRRYFYTELDPDKGLKIREK
jgi:hypothetical protein